MEQQPQRSPVVIPVGPQPVQIEEEQERAVEEQPPRSPIIHIDPQPVQQVDQEPPLVREEERQPQVLNNNSLFNLPGFSRAPNSARSCIFYGCENMSRQRIAESVKMKLIMEYNYYIPPEARVCHDHSLTDSWQILLDSPNRRFDFHPQYTLNIIQLLKKYNNRNLDFETIEDFDEAELRYWTGRTLNEFLQILQETPSLFLSTRKPKTTLGVYLAKLRTGEADDRLASIFKMTRQNLEKNKYRKTMLNCRIRSTSFGIRSYQS